MERHFEIFQWFVSECFHGFQGILRKISSGILEKFPTIRSRDFLPKLFQKWFQGSFQKLPPDFLIECIPNFLKNLISDLISEIIWGYSSWTSQEFSPALFLRIPTILRQGFFLEHSWKIPAGVVSGIFFEILLETLLSIMHKNLFGFFSRRTFSDLFRKFSKLFNWHFFYIYYFFLEIHRFQEGFSKINRFLVYYFSNNSSRNSFSYSSRTSLKVSSVICVGIPPGFFRDFFSKTFQR